MKRRLGLVAVAMLLSLQSAVLAAQELKPFGRGSQQQIAAARTGKPFIVAFWSVSCTYCGAELAMFGKLLKKYPALDLVLVSTDTPADGKELTAVLGKHALGRAEAWVFADSHADRLRFEVDPEWYGELPRTYFHGAKDGVQASSGKMELVDVERWLIRQQR